LSEYEVVFIIKATETDEVIDGIVAQMEEVAKQQGGEMIKADRWGRRKLAYDIGKQREGYYVLFHLRAERGAISELERKFKMNDAVIRFLTIRIDDEIRRARRKAVLRARKKGVEPGAELPAPLPRPRDQVEEEDEPLLGDTEEEGEV
jgi:small subunit ribosomal protein S6